MKMALSPAICRRVRVLVLCEDHIMAFEVWVGVRAFSAEVDLANTASSNFTSTNTWYLTVWSIHTRRQDVAHLTLLYYTAEEPIVGAAAMRRGFHACMYLYS